MLNKHTPTYSPPALILLHQAQTCPLRVWPNSSTPAWDNREYSIFLGTLWMGSSTSQAGPGSLSSLLTPLRADHFGRGTSTKLREIQGSCFHWALCWFTAMLCISLELWETLGKESGKGCCSYCSQLPVLMILWGQQSTTGKEHREETNWQGCNHSPSRAGNSHRCNYCLTSTTAKHSPSQA